MRHRNRVRFGHYSCRSAVLGSGPVDVIAPGFIDIQVNGFAGVDYNSPEATHEEIARSIFAIFSTGVTRFFPTVITGEPEKMLGALKNLAAARESLEHGKRWKLSMWRVRIFRQTMVLAARILRGGCVRRISKNSDDFRMPRKEIFG